ncbi:MAG: WYL domain-containing protein [Phycisphaerales bacterium]|nr:MAG: WYL domain-containing protein [Phycisphaerales bacterium]
MSYTRIHRLLRIITLIQSGRPWNAAQLAQECETTERTIFRDLKELEGAGVPVEYDGKWGGYRVRETFFLPPVQLTAEEGLALAALCEHISEPQQIPFLRAAWRALHKLEAHLPPELRHEIDERRKTLLIKTAPAMEPDGYRDVYDCMQNAIIEQRVMRCKYDAAASDSSDDEAFDFHPYALFFGVRAWYVVGHHAQRDALRSLKLSRFNKATPTETRFDRPPDFNLDAYLGNAWRMMNAGDDVEVVLHFDAHFTPTITDTRWHRTQSFEYHRDGSCTFRCTVAGFDEIAWWILSMGPHCRVLDPPELRQRIHDLAARTAALYTESAK